MKKLLLLVITTTILFSCKPTDLTFNEMVDLSYEEALSIQPLANFYEASATKNENGIKSVFQGVKNTTILVAVSSTGAVVSEVVDSPFMDDVVIKLPVKMTLEEAEQLLLDAGYGTGIEGVADWSIVVLRRPLGPEVTPALYIFTTSKGYVSVNTITKEVGSTQALLGENQRVLRIATGLFAFCGASAAVPTGKKMTVQGVEFDEGCAICPVLEGPSIYSLAMNGEGSLGEFDASDFKATPDGTDKTVWSLFWYYSSSDSIPQFNPDNKEWEIYSPVNRSFTIDMSSPSTSESDMFQMPCEIWKTENGILLSKCYGPLNHMALPLRRPISTENGQISITAAKEGFPYPVGTPVSLAELSKDLQK
tara:strand:- start:105 stop:1196 length:1092 start_codon:yes stop_codon:yes gene_type:complete